MQKLIAPISALLLMGLVGCGNGETRDAAAPAESTVEAAAEPQQPAEQLPREAAFGEKAGAANDGSEFAITASTPKDFTEFSEAPVEGKYVVVEVQAELLGGDGGAVAATSFMLADASGTEYPNAAPNGTNMDGMLFATLLSKGDSGSGKVVFDVPADTTGFVLKYQPIGATEAIATWR
ncbi:protein of unknown function [Saccharopolyspora shandongensis]|uniref:DUF4352 domain-containing protein n=1 Tax=Saccharopolyspora shandongensis TaxID=418495 RepID=A0A1H2RSB8_9PSEU|nr:DUF4352 domain-containing protein [Saccharopolyspora shandongensis]SDW22178.1 protein of unknown function [Saccharopolyspora shandongensis]